MFQYYLDDEQFRNLTGLFLWTVSVCLSLLFKCRTSLQPALGLTWDLHGDLVISWCMRPFTRHPVCVDIYSSTSFAFSFSCLMSHYYLLSCIFRCQRIRMPLYPWGQERWRHILPYSTQTLQWVTSHLCRPANHWRGPPQQEQKIPVRPNDGQIFYSCACVINFIAKVDEALMN